MSSLNKVLIIGRLGQDPELRYTASQKPVANFTVATSTKDSTGKETTEWHRIIVWDKLAENCMQYLKKGKLCYVEGRLTTRTWEKDGHKNYTTEIVAHTVQFLSPNEGATPVAPPQGFNFNKNLASSRPQPAPLNSPSQGQAWTPEHDPLDEIPF